MTITNITHGFHGRDDESGDLITAGISALSLAECIKKPVALCTAWKWIIYRAIPENLTYFATG